MGKKLGELMKYRIFAVFAIMLLLSACVSSNDKEAAKLKEQGDEHYKNHQLDSAIVVYEKSLALKEDIDVRNSLQVATNELAAVKNARSIINELDSLKTKLKQAGNDSEILEMIKKVESSFNEFKKIKSPSKTTISNFITTLNQNDTYKSFETRTSLAIISLQLGNGDADIFEYIKLLEDIIEKTSFLDIYK
ncbi:hypothetical protein [Paenibacillus sp. GXUN7292]|uniref:hypothetical protein n=1 Tax=Paenibacillus sp. GXUN7292 TaxID=3422499 RepID=UPI003D7E4015